MRAPLPPHIQLRLCGTKQRIIEAAATGQPPRMQRPQRPLLRARRWPASRTTGPPPLSRRSRRRRRQCAGLPPAERPCCWRYPWPSPAGWMKRPGISQALSGTCQKHAPICALMYSCAASCDDTVPAGLPRGGNSQMKDTEMHVGFPGCMHMAIMVLQPPVACRRETRAWKM